MENAKNVKVLLRMPREMKADIEAIAYIENKKQSEIMRDAIAEYLKQHPIGELLPLKSGSFLFRRRVLLHRFSTGVISGSPCPTER